MRTEEKIEIEYKIDFVAQKIHRGRYSSDDARRINSEAGWHIVGDYILPNGKIKHVAFSGPLPYLDIEEAIKRARKKKLPAVMTREV